LVLFLNLFVFVTILYNFVIVAVTDDYSPLLSSKTFFYFAYIFFPTWMVRRHDDVELAHVLANHSSC
jgi:hypothetical protein